MYLYEEFDNNKNKNKKKRTRKWKEKNKFIDNNILINMQYNNFGLKLDEVHLYLIYSFKYFFFFNSLSTWIFLFL